MKQNKYIFQLLFTVVAIITLAACSKNSESHTTVITQIPPPPQQVLSVISKPVPPTPVPRTLDPTADPKKPLILFHLQDGKSFRVGEEVPIEFSVLNAKLKADGGEFRVRYIVDDDDMQWLDNADSFWLEGWIPGKHTIRIELIGPNGWPYKNGNANIVTKEITITEN
jgi:hypothetical protein